LITGQELGGKCLQFFGSIRGRDFQEIEPPGHAFQVLGHAKRAAVDDPHRFKQAVDQALMLRGSRDFASRGDYQLFLKKLMAGRNATRKERFHEEMAVLSSLPSRRLEMARRLQARVDSGSTIHVGGNTYSLPSRLIGEKVDVHEETPTKEAPEKRRQRAVDS